jgi:cyanate permease
LARSFFMNNAPSRTIVLSEDAFNFRWWVLSAVWLSYFSFGLTAVTLAPLVSQITGDLGMNNAHMGTVMGAWQLVYIASAIPCGILLHRIGTRHSILMAFVLIGLSAMMRALAYDHLSLFLAVAIFGLGGPLVSIGAPKLISVWFAGKERGLAMGIYMTGMALGSMAGLSLTHSIMMPLMDGNWRGVLLGYGSFVFVSGFVWFVITSSKIFQEQEKRQAALPHDPQFKALWELIRIPSVMIALLMGIGIFFFGHGLNNWLPEILIASGMNEVEAGYWASGPTVVGIFSALLIPRLATPGTRVKIMTGLFAAALISTVLLHYNDPYLLGVAVIMQGIARGAMMTMAILILLDLKEVGPTRTGLVGGLFFTFAEIGGVLGPVTIGTLSAYYGDFSVSLWMLSIICVLLFLLLSYLPRSHANNE